jgi:Protein of unknown function (DUF998)
MSRRLAAWAAVLLVAAAAAMVLAAGVATPGYDAATKTVSRLAMPGLPYAAAVDAAMVAVAASCAALAFSLDRGLRLSRIALAAAAISFAIAVFVHLDDASQAATWTHRSASGAALLCLAVAPLFVRGRYGAISLVAGWLEIGLMLVAAALLLTPFAMWGAWERVAIAVPLAWIAFTARKIASSEATESTTSTTSRSILEYAGKGSVTSAKR